MARRAAAPTNEVPYLPDKHIEAEADLVLGEFAEKFRPIEAWPVPIEQIAEVLLQLQLEFIDMKAMFPFADVHGAIWFKEGRIGIEEQLEPEANPSRRGRYHFTLAHEVGHWRLHRSHYLQDARVRQLFDDRAPRPDVVCRSSERKKRVEWQADRFSSSLMMPRKLVYEAWRQFRDDDSPVEFAEIRDQFAAYDAIEPIVYRGKIAATEEEKNKALAEEFCRPLASDFAVSPEAMRIRLETLNLIVEEKPAMLF